MANRFENIGLIGLGVIGASLGMALKHGGTGIRIWGRDLDPAVIAKAVEIEAIDAALDDEALARCDLVFICTPLKAIQSTLEELKGRLRAGTLVSDVGSVKEWVMNAFQAILPEHVHYIGGHPMAGSEKKGISAADKFLLENAAYVITPPESAPNDLLADFSALIASTGARVIRMQADEHDRAVARVSHLPHVIAAALMHGFADTQENLALAGGSLRDMTRVAGSDSDLWRWIFQLNKKALLREIGQFARDLHDVETLIAEENWPELVAFLDQVRLIKQQLAPDRRWLEDAVDIVAIVPDQPGMIGRIGQILGEEQINIKDMYVLSVRDEDEGSIKLSVPRPDGERACQVLTARGLISWIRD